MMSEAAKNTLHVVRTLAECEAVLDGESFGNVNSMPRNDLRRPSIAPEGADAYALLITPKHLRGMFAKAPGVIEADMAIDRLRADIHDLLEKKALEHQGLPKLKGADAITKMLIVDDRGFIRTPGFFDPEEMEGMPALWAWEDGGIELAMRWNGFWSENPVPLPIGKTSDIYIAGARALNHGLMIFEKGFDDERAIWKAFLEELDRRGIVWFDRKLDACDSRFNSQALSVAVSPSSLIRAADWNQYVNMWLSLCDLGARAGFDLVFHPLRLLKEGKVRSSGFIFDFLHAKLLKDDLHGVIDRICGGDNSLLPLFAAENRKGGGDPMGMGLFRRTRLKLSISPDEGAPKDHWRISLEMGFPAGATMAVEGAFSREAIPSRMPELVRKFLGGWWEINEGYPEKLDRVFRMIS